MTTGLGSDKPRRRPARWLLLPLTMGLFALIGMAVSAEDRQRTEQDTVSVGSPSGGPSDQEIPSAGPGAAGSPPDGGLEGEPTSTTAPTDDGADGAESSGNDGGSSTEPVNMEVSGPTGRLGVQLGGANPVARPIGPDDIAGTPSELVEGPQGPAAQTPGAGPGSTTAPAGDGSAPGAPTVGLELGADGQLQPVSQDQIAPGDLVVAPAGGGLDVLRPDGTRVQIRPGASSDGSGLVASEVTAGGVTGLQPAEGGQIDVGDGITVTLPTPDPIDLSNDTEGGISGPRWAQLAALAVALVLLLVGLGLWLRRRRRARAATATATEGDAVAPPIPANQIDALLASLAADPDPARAIRLAFSAAERGMGRLPARRSTETPFEWYRRVAGTEPDLAEALAGLCACFANTRFSSTPPTAGERDAAVGELRQLHTLGRGPAGTGAGTAPTRAEVGAGV
ncbi:MAG: DUF4129 domain-containing protein [Acidimicrobiales bacterium]